MSRRDYPFNKKHTKWGTNLVSTLIAWTIAAPFAMGDTSYNIPSTSNNADKKPKSKILAIITIILGILLAPLFFALIKHSFNTESITSIFPIISITITIVVYAKILYIVLCAFEDNEFDSIIKYLEKRNPDYCNKTKEKYYSIIKHNKGIDKKKIKLTNRLKKFVFRQNLTKILSLPNKESKYLKNIELIKSEINSLEKRYLKQVISLDSSATDNTTQITPKDTYILNGKIGDYWHIDFENQHHKCIKKNNSFFETNIPSRLSLHYDSVEYHFYDKVMIIMSKDNFVIIDYNNIYIEENIFTIQLHSSNSKSNFNVLWEEWEHPCKNGLPDLRYKHNDLCIYVEIATIGLNIFSKNINFAFTEKNDAKFIYNLISNKK